MAPVTRSQTGSSAQKGYQSQEDRRPQQAQQAQQPEPPELDWVARLAQRRAQQTQAAQAAQTATQAPVITWVRDTPTELDTMEGAACTLLDLSHDSWERTGPRKVVVRGYTLAQLERMEPETIEGVRALLFLRTGDSRFLTRPLAELAVPELPALPGQNPRVTRLGPCRLRVNTRGL